MQTLLTITTLAVCVLLVMVVLVQNSKGGGISAQYVTAHKVMGARRSANFIEKTTWVLAGLLLVLSVTSASY